MLGPAGKTGRHAIPGRIVELPRDIAQERLVKTLQRHVGIRQHVPCRRPTLSDAQVVIAVDQRTGQPRKEDRQPEIGHLRIARNQPIIVRVAIKHQQLILAAQRNTGLIQQAVVQSDILALSFRSDLGHLHLRQRNVVRPGKGHYIGNQHRRTRREAPHGERPLEHTPYAAMQLEAFAKGILGPAGIIAPVPLPDKRRLRQIETDFPLEGFTLQIDRTILRHVKPKIDPLVQGKAGHQSMLVIDMRPYGTNTVRRKQMMRVRSSHTFPIIWMQPRSPCRTPRTASFWT